MQVHSRQSSASPAVSSLSSALCPHGMSPMACPACSGGSAGGGGGAKPKPAGLMGWNEAFAIWNALKVADTRKQDYLKSAQAAQNTAMQQQAASQFSTPTSWMTALNQRLATGLAALLQRLGFPQAVSPANPFTTPANAAPSGEEALGLGQQLRVLTQQATQRLNLFLNEVARLVENAFAHNLEVLKSLMAQLKWQAIAANAWQALGRLLNPTRIPGQSTLDRLGDRLRETTKEAFNRLLGWFGMGESTPSLEESPSDFSFKPPFSS